VRIIKEGQLLLAADPGYLVREAAQIIRAVFEQCRNQIFETADRTILSESKGLDSLGVTADRRFLDMDPGEDLTAALAQYAE
jgi:hypothetical protein